MHLQSCQINNFGCFENLNLDFDEKLTVLVGVNGVGKTTILHAVSHLLLLLSKLYLNSIPNFISFDESIIKRNAQLMSLKYHVSINNAIIEPVITAEYTKKGDKYTYHFEDYKDFGEEINKMHKNNVFIYYMSNRVIPFDLKQSSSTVGFNDIFANKFTPQINFDLAASWFKDKVSEEAREAVNTDNIKFRLPELEAVRKAVSKALGEYHDPYVINTPPEIYINKITDEPRDKKTAVKVQQLSDGYRTMLALVMDLAMRMAVANANAEWVEGETVLHSPGIVLIDEVELHLHPSWQQTVLPTLMDIFPNVQFIVSTHSPQILTSVKENNIRILNGKGQVYSAPKGTWGAEVSRVLEQVMFVEKRPPCEATKDLLAYADLVYKDKWESEEAVKLRQILDERYHDSEPMLTTLDLYIDNRKWELETE